MALLTYTQPFFALLLIVVVGLTLANRPRSRPYLIAATIVLFLFCWPPAAWLALQPLESRYSQTPPANHDVEAIVVLSSAVFLPSPPRPTAILGSDTYERCKYAAWLNTHWKQVPVLASGGGSNGGAPYAVTMSEALIADGVPASMIWTEQGSKSTYENAGNSAAILRQHGIRRIALVTEAYHMRRAEAVFKKQGLEVIPAPCGFRAYEVRSHDILPSWEAISWNEDSMHEAIALFWYWVKGRV